MSTSLWLAILGAWLLIAFALLTNSILSERERQQRSAKRRRRARQRLKPGTTDLTGAPCEHKEWHRWRGYVMCNNPLCGEIRNMDGQTLTREQRFWLDKKLREEQADE